MRACVPILLAAVSAGASGAPPVHEGSVLLEPSNRAVQPLETIRIRTQWDSAGYVITPDFSGLDGGGGGSPAVQDAGGGSYFILYTTGAMSGLPDSAGVVIPIRAINPAIPDTFTYRSFGVCRRATRDLPEHVSTTVRGNQVVFRPADSLIVVSLWRTHDAPGFRLEADYDALVEGFQPGTARFSAISADSLGVDTFRVAYRIPVNGIGEDRGGIPLRLVARDSLCSAIPSTEFMITLYLGEGPKPLEHRVVQPTGRGVRDGDTVVIWSRWDQGGYVIRPDFTELDGGLGGFPSVVDSSAVDSAAAGSYMIHYTPGPMSGLPDASVTVSITAVDSLGDSFTDRSLRVCRNHSSPPPVHGGTTFLEPRTKIGPSDSLMIVTRWRSPVGAAITVEPDFRALVPSFVPADARVDPLGPDSFLVLYRTPEKDDLVSERAGIPLIIRARDELCSEVFYDSLTIELDTTPPEFPPTFDPLPAETNVGSLQVGGFAPGAVRVNVYRNNRLYETVDVNDADRFGLTLLLDPGVNRINANSLDDVGNPTAQSPSHLVRYVTARTTVYSTPFRPGDEIAVQDEAGLREAIVSIYNLEGDLLAHFEDRSATFEVRFIWNGRDRDGDLARPGYYLMRVERTTADGERRDEVLPLLFRNDQ